MLGRRGGRCGTGWKLAGSGACSFDSATDPQVLRPFLPAAGQARVIITSNRQSVVALGAGVPVGVFSEPEALTFTVDGPAVTVTAHRLVMRVIRENLAANGLLAATCQVAARVLDQHAQAMSECWHEDRAAARTLVEQASAVTEAADRCPAEASLDRGMTRLRWWVVWYLNKLGDSAGQAIMLGERLAADQGRLRGPDHPDTLTSLDNLAAAYQAAGRTTEPGS